MKKSWVDIHKDEVLSDNSKVENCKQCKDCIFQNDGTVWSNDYQKSCCQIYKYPNFKPLYVINNKGICEYHNNENDEKTKDNKKEGGLMDWDKKIEEEIKKNPELKKVFDVDPKKKELYKQKLMDSWNEHSGGSTINPEYCKTCVFKQGEPPFGDLPTKAYCMIYTKEKGVAKPRSVYFDGARCEYYQNEKKDDK